MLDLNMSHGKTSLASTQWHYYKFQIKNVSNDFKKY